MNELIRRRYANGRSGGQNKMITRSSFHKMTKSQYITGNKKNYLSGIGSAERKADFMRSIRAEGGLEKYPPYFAISVRNCKSRTNCKSKQA